MDYVFHQLLKGEAIILLHKRGNNIAVRHKGKSDAELAAISQIGVGGFYEFFHALS